MKSFKITGIKVINSVKGREVNSVYLELHNAPSIRRSFSQFLIDLKNNASFGIPEDATMSHPLVRQALRTLKNGTVSGDLQVINKGDKYIVTEESSVLTNPQHPEFGKYALGEEATVLNDGTRVVDGFLSLEPDMMAASIQDAANNAMLYIMQSVNGAGIATPASNSATEEVEEDIDDLTGIEYDEAIEGSAK